MYILSIGKDACFYLFKSKRRDKILRGTVWNKIDSPFPCPSTKCIQYLQRQQIVLNYQLGIFQLIRVNVVVWNLLPICVFFKKYVPYTVAVGSNHLWPLSGLVQCHCLQWIHKIGSGNPIENAEMRDKSRFFTNFWVSILSYFGITFLKTIQTFTCWTDALTFLLDLSMMRPYISIRGFVCLLIAWFVN